MEVNISNEVTIKELSEVVNIDGGYAFKSDEFVQNKTPIIRIGNIVDGNVEIDYNIGYDIEDKNFDKYLININDILVAMSGATTGKLAMYRNNNIALLNQRVGRFSVIDKNILDNKYLYYYLRSDFVQRKIKVLASGCAQPNISPKQLLSIHITVPPLETQKKIVDVLEKAEKALEKRKEANKLMDELVKSQFIEMFGDPIINSKKLPMRPLGEICNMKAGKSIKANDISEFFEEGMYPCYGGNGLRGYVRSYTHEGAIPLIGRQGALCGNAQYAKGKFYATEHAVVTQPKVQMDTCWLYIMLREMNLNRLATGAAQPGLNVSTLVPIEVIVPSIESQNQFADFVNQVDKLKFEMQKSLEEMENNFNSLMQRAFNGGLLK